MIVERTNALMFVTQVEMEDLSDEEGVEAIEEAGVDTAEDDSREVSAIHIFKHFS